MEGVIESTFNTKKCYYILFWSVMVKIISIVFTFYILDSIKECDEWYSNLLGANILFNFMFVCITMVGIGIGILESDEKNENETMGIIFIMDFLPNSLFHIVFTIINISVISYFEKYTQRPLVLIGYYIWNGIVFIAHVIIFIAFIMTAYTLIKDNMRKNILKELDIKNDRDLKKDSDIHVE